MKILLLRTWKTNIGNGFIEKGAKAALRKAFPDSEITEVSGYSYYAERNVEEGIFSGLGVGKLSIAQKGITNFKERYYRGDKVNFVSVGELTDLDDIDLAVLPGCVLYEHALGRYEDVLNRLRSREIPLLVLGGGGGDYGEEAQKYTRDFLKDYPDIGLITRDEKAFEVYKDDLDNAESGIDCAFFINDWYNPPDSEKEFVVANFDKTDESGINTDKMIIRTSHTPFGEPFGSLLNRVFSDKYRTEQENFFVSDNLRDYLFIYANADEVHSDRVHACLPALVYGNKAKFTFDTPRAGLFDRMDIEWGEDSVELDQKLLEKQKSRQVERIKSVVSKLVD